MDAKHKNTPIFVNFTIVRKKKWKLVKSAGITIGRKPNDSNLDPPMKSCTH